MLHEPNSRQPQIKRSPTKGGHVQLGILNGPPTSHFDPRGTSHPPGPEGHPISRHRDDNRQEYQSASLHRSEPQTQHSRPSAFTRGSRLTGCGAEGLTRRSCPKWLKCTNGVIWIQQNTAQSNRAQPAGARVTTLNCQSPTTRTDALAEPQASICQSAHARRWRTS